MIVYNVTVNVDDSIHDAWKNWMQEDHIPQVMQTQCFSHFKMFRLLDRQSDETGTTYAIQYYADTIEKYQSYRELFAPGLQQETLRLWGDAVMAFRTLLESVE